MRSQLVQPVHEVVKGGINNKKVTWLNVLRKAYATDKTSVPDIEALAECTLKRTMNQNQNDVHRAYWRSHSMIVMAHEIL